MTINDRIRPGTRRGRTFFGVLVYGVLFLSGGLPGRGVLAADTLVPVEVTAPDGFTYHGQLTEWGIPANGFFDFRFIVTDAQGLPSLTIELRDVSVTDGAFSADLGFGSTDSLPTEARLAVAVRAAGSNDEYTDLAPAQSVLMAPCAALSQGGTFSLVGTSVGQPPGDDSRLGARSELDSRSGTQGTQDGSVTTESTSVTTKCTDTGDSSASDLLVRGRLDVGADTRIHGTLEVGENSFSAGTGPGSSEEFVGSSFGELNIGKVDLSQGANAFASFPNILVGIGTTTPSVYTGTKGLHVAGQLRVSDDINQIPNLLINNSSNPGVGLQLALASGPTSFSGVASLNDAVFRTLLFPSEDIIIALRNDGDASDSAIRFTTGVTGSCGDSQKMVLSHLGDLGIGTIFGTDGVCGPDLPNEGVTARLDVGGDVRIRSLPSPNNGLNDVVVSDASGFLYTRDASTLPGGGGGFTGAQNGTSVVGGNTVELGLNPLIHDTTIPLNGHTLAFTGLSSTENVGIGIPNPTQKLDVNGIVRVHVLDGPATTHVCIDSLGDLSSCATTPLTPLTLGPGCSAAPGGGYIPSYYVDVIGRVHYLGGICNQGGCSVPFVNPPVPGAGMVFPLATFSNSNPSCLFCNPIGVGAMVRMAPGNIRMYNFPAGQCAFFDVVSF